MATAWLKAFPPEPAPVVHRPRRVPKKKGPVKKPTNNRNVGKLAGIMKVPLEVFYEVRRSRPFAHRLA